MPDPDIRRYHCFPQTLREGLRWFETQAAAQGGSVEKATIPNERGPGGAALSTAVGWFGDRRAERVLLSIAGTHGQEYFCGAAGQLDWIASAGPQRLPQNVAVCLVHAHNPYGAAFLSRANEDFIDLNRNFNDFSQPIRRNRLYPELFDLLFTTDMDEHILDDVMATFYQFVEDNDTAEVMTAMGGGQDTHPTGTLYCGTEQAWSTQTLRSIVDEYLGHAEKVAVIDWHTGLGEPADAVALEKQAPGSPERAWAEEFWPAAGAAGELEGPELPDYVGEVWRGVADDIRSNGAAAVSTVVEVGTVGNQSVLAALLIDRWLRFECRDPESPKAVEYRTKMIERLNPSRPEWRAGALSSMANFYERTLTGLQTWA